MFEPFGKICEIIRYINAVRGSADGDGNVGTDEFTLLTELQDLVTAWPYELRQSVNALASSFDNHAAASDALITALRARAETLLIEFVKALNPLTESSLNAAIPGFILAMTGAGQYVNPTTVAVGVTYGGSNAGNGVVAASVVDGVGKQSFNVLQEDIEATVISSSATSASLEFRGEEAVPALSAEWPKGSGSRRTVASIGTSSSLAANPGFENFTVANTPDDYTIVTGTPGTTIFSEASVVYTGAKSLKITGNGSENTQIYQSLTPGSFSARTPYCLAVALRVSSVPAAGVLTIDLHNGTSTINDDAGTANSLAISLPGLTTSYQFKTVFFRLPEPLPSTLRLRFRLSTALSNTHSVYIDHVVLQKATEIYDHGPWVAATSGSTQWSLKDTSTLALTSNRAGPYQEWFDRLYGMKARRLLLPTAGSTLISESYLG
jgi:hypothetical protein